MAKTAKRNKGGRPSKLNDISLMQVEKLAGYNLTEKEIADIIEICEKTLSNYKSNKKFLQALKKGKAKADNYVVGSLFHRAIGYTHPEVKVFCNARGKVTKVNVFKHYPPDPLAAIFWLKNRKPKDWRDKHEIEHSIPEHLLEKYKGASIESLRKQATELLRKTGRGLGRN